MVADHSSNLQPLQRSFGPPLFHHCFQSEACSSSLCHCHCSQQPSPEGCLPRKETTSAQKLLYELSAGSARCQTHMLWLSVTSRDSTQTNPCTRGLHTAISGSEKRGSCVPLCSPSQLSSPLGRCEAPRLFSVVPSWQIGLSQCNSQAVLCQGAKYNLQSGAEGAAL